MANRKTKLDYIQLPSNHIVQRDVRKMIRIFNIAHPGLGAVAYSVLICLYGTMARDSAGYFVEYDEDLIADIANELCLEENLVRDSIEAAVKAGILNEKLFSSGIVSSYEYQLMYFNVATKLGRIIDYKSMPYIIIEPDLFHEKDTQSQGKDYTNSSMESSHSRMECADTQKECIDSSQVNTDSLRNCRRNERYEKSKIEVGENISAQTRQEPPFFSFEKLNDIFLVLLNQPKWQNKTPDAISIAVQKLKEYDPFVAIEIIEHTIMTGIRDLDPPTPKMIEKAHENLVKFKKIHKSDVVAQNRQISHSISFSMMSEPDENVPQKIVHTIRNAMTSVIKRSNDTIHTQLLMSYFKLSAQNLSIQASKPAIEWLKADGIPELKDYKIEFLPI